MEPLHTSIHAFQLAEIARQQNGLLLVVAPDMHTAYQLQQELPFFLEGSDVEVLAFADWETLPYDPFSPHQDLVSRRLHLLSRLPRLTRGVLVVAIQTLMQPCPPLSYVQANSLVLRKGDPFDLHIQRAHLEQAGYQCVSQVATHGEFAVRGSIIDIYPMGAALPYRIDLFDNDIDTIRSFDPETQRSIDKLDQLVLLPAREYPLDDTGADYFVSRWTELFPNHLDAPVLNAVEDHRPFPGLEYYLPLFFTEPTNLLAHLPKNTQHILLESSEQQAQNFWQTISQRYQQYQHDRQKPLVPPAQLFTEPSALFTTLQSYQKIQESPSTESFTNDIAAQPKSTEPLLKLQQFLAQTSMRVLLCCESAGRREIMLQHLARLSLQPTAFTTWPAFLQNQTTLGMIIAPLEQGCIIPSLNIAIITENQLFADRVMQRRRRTSAQKYAEGILIRDLSELNIGDAVVHIQHGVGRYQGLTTLNLSGNVAEFLTLYYSGNDKLYVPITSLHLVSRYSGQDVDHAPLHKLGTDKWGKEKAKAVEQLRDVAAELLEIYAKREAKPGFAYPAPDLEYQRFSDQFPFEETPDQALSIEAVLKDMQSSKPMDRLLCGDVGFGKTEVALRAAFIAVHAGKQVAILVPTTLLAQQHYNNFSDRFAGWPVTVDMLSRFKTASEQQESLQKLADGKIDIIIGTHSLLGKNVKFKNLGLVVIDEEHRFGVTDKEKLKAMRADVDILTMTATPIPRTLNMAMSQIRDLSIIATPPAKRLSVKTFIQQHSDAQVKEAILREITRGGQVFLLHNNVETIEQTAHHIQELLPTLRVAVGHGQMRERQLEQIMADFYHNRYQILVCTTIIETGIDIPNANTMIIDRADKFGLAQLHQLRGRVGRSHHQAYAYLFTPPFDTLTKDAQKRLEALAAADTLGAGFTIASHDLEIRGAGELLGDDQSGHIQSIGFNLYLDLLERTVQAMKQGKTISADDLDVKGCEIELHIPCLIPQDYLPDVQLRLQLYQRISNGQNQAELDQVQIDMIDRFGLLTDPIKNLFNVASLRLQAEALGIKRIDATAKNIKLEFDNPPKISPDKIIRLIQKNPQRYKMSGPNGLNVSEEIPEAEQRIKQTSTLLSMLTGSNG